MSTTTNRETAPRDGGSVGHRLARLLDTPFLARVVPHLAPETLHQLIQYRGLDACGELVTSATPAQLSSLLDLDLWRHAQPGRDEQFDVDRFGEWLEVLVDTGDSVAARTVAALDKPLVIVGLPLPAACAPKSLTPSQARPETGPSALERRSGWNPTPSPPTTLTVQGSTCSGFHRSSRRSSRPIRAPTTNTHAARITIPANTPVVSNTPSAWAIR